MGNVVRFEDLLPGDFVILKNSDVDFEVSGEVNDAAKISDYRYDVSLITGSRSHLVFSSVEFEITEHLRPLKMPEAGRFLKFRVTGAMYWSIGVWNGEQFSGVMDNGKKKTIVSSFENVKWEYVD